MPTVALLCDSFEGSLRTLVSSGNKRPKTADFYRHQLKKLRAAAGTLPADCLRPYHLANVRFTHHFVRACKAVYRWAADEEIVPRNPFSKIKTPRCGQRQRTLTRPEMAALYRAAGHDFKRYLYLCRYTIARPGEVRELCWGHVHLDQRVIALTEFKAKDRRGDGAEVRVIPLANNVVRMLRTWRERAGDVRDDTPVLSNRRGRPHTANGIRSSMRRARQKAGLNTKGELVVCYTMRHTSATEATRNGVRDRRLAQIMGHTSTRTTQRYQHLDAADLVEGIDQAFGRRRSPRR